MRNDILGGRADAAVEVDGRLGQAVVERISGGTERLNALIADLASKLEPFVLLKEETGREPAKRREEIMLPPFFLHVENLACENDKALNTLELIVSSLKL